MSLRKKTVKGLTWLGMAQAGKQAYQFAITAVLARLLSPDDFGLLGMATVFIGFVTIFGEMGVSSALIQKQDADDHHLSSAFWLNIATGLVLTVIFWAAAPLIAAFYDKPKLTLILQFSSLNFIFASFTVIQQAILMKEMDFKSLAIRDIGAVVASGVIGVSLAYAGFGVWALVYQFLTFTLFNSILLWIFSKWRPGFTFSLSAIKDIFNFSANMTGFLVLNYFARNVDYLLIGKFLGAEALGYYTLAYKLMLVPLRNISEVIGKVMFPAFSRIQDDLDKVRTAYQKMVKAISLVTFPMMLGLFAIAPEFVNVVFGQKWEPVIMLLRIFCFCGMFQSIGTTVGNILLSQGRADLHLKLQILGTAIVIGSILIGLRWGINGVAFCYTVQTVVWTHFILYITNRIIRADHIRFYYQLTNSYMIGFTVLVILLLSKLLFIRQDWFNLIGAVLVGMATTLAMLALTKEINLSNKKLLIKVIQ